MLNQFLLVIQTSGDHNTDLQPAIPNTVQHGSPEVQPIDPPRQPAPILLLHWHKHTYR